MLMGILISSCRDAMVVGSSDLKTFGPSVAAAVVAGGVSR